MSTDTPVVEMEGLKTRLMVGLEIHVELATRSKMWTSAPNVAHADYFDAEPNTLLDPVVIGMPGTLPVMNGKAVEMAIRVGLAMGCEIARWCKWDRKSYYYPDLPKNYQISQYDLPLCGKGVMEVAVSDEPDAAMRPVRIIRAHLEEDAGKLLHEAVGGGMIDYSIVDLNRAGTPLLEIVTEPDFVTAGQVVRFGQTLRNICRFLGVTEGVMQRGQMRFEPNINVAIEKDGKTYKTPIVEIKNLNSFKAVQGSIEYEHERQVMQWLEDGKVMSPGSKSTRGWDDAKGVTVLQREKEDAHDYRYFPDPDLVPVTVGEEWLEELRATIPELPVARERRYVTEYGLNVRDARALVGERDVCLFFEALVSEGVEGKRAATICRNNLARLANERGCGVHELGISAKQVAGIDAMQRENQISSNGADTLYGKLCASGDEGMTVEEAAKKYGLIQVSDDSQLDGWVMSAILCQPQAAEDVRAGKTAAIGRLVGEVMKQSGGQANPKLIQAKLREKLTPGS